MTYRDVLQNLVEKERAKSGAQAILLRVQSGDGRIDFAGSAGAALPGIRFPIASISKMFTAALILQLVDDRALDLDQTAQSVLPGIDLSDLHIAKGVAHGPELTIRQLLFQTSGLADYYEGGIANDLINNRDRGYDFDTVLAMAKARRPFAAPDTGRAHYSDTNFQLLGAVIEAVTGQPFGAVLRERICNPLGLSKTALFDDEDRDTGDVTLPVHHKALKLHVPKILSSMGPDGGIVSDMGDLMTFLRAHLSGRLFAPDHLPRLKDFRSMTFPLRYGGGLMRFKLPNWMTLWQGSPELIGHSVASASFAYRAPEHDVFLVGTYNQTDMPKRPFGLMMKVLKALEQGG